MKLVNLNLNRVVQGEFVQPYFIFMDYWKNFSPHNITAIINGILYTEEWESVNKYENYYQVSTFGRFISLRDEKIMRQHKNEKGYLTIGLTNGIERKKYKSHRIVGIVFIENPENKPEINHDDFDKTNNFYKNLHWATGKENTNHAQRGGKVPIAAPKQKVGEYPIKCQKIVDSETGELFESVFQLSDITGYTVKYLRKMLSGEVKNRTNYTWLKGQWTLFYKKRHDIAVARYKELKPIIYGVSFSAAATP